MKLPNNSSLKMVSEKKKHVYNPTYSDRSRRHVIYAYAQSTMTYSVANEGSIYEQETKTAL